MTVGGSQNLLACGVWSLVRMTILVGVLELVRHNKRAAMRLTHRQTAASHASYLDRVSSLFMQISRSAPSYDALALLFAQSTRL
jgi:hypothetical protein